MKLRFIIGLAAATTAAFLVGCSNNDGAGADPAGLAAECSDGDVVSDSWVCPDSLTVECQDGRANPDFVYFVPGGDPPPACDELDYVLNDEGPFGVGTHEIVIRIAPEGPMEEPGEVLCETTLTVEDTEAPSAIDEPIELWPPNHKWHTISGADCVRDRCDGDELDVTFRYASSDEPVNDTGDGNTEPDILLACDRVQLRSERRGPSNGRVYTLGWTAVDDAGNESEGECVVVVPHDQSGREAVDDGPAYELTLPAEACDDGTGGSGGAAGMGGSGGSGGEDGAGGSGGAAGMGGAGGSGGGIVVP